MSVYDLWKGLSKAEVEARRRAGRPRWQRRWREGVGADARQRKQSYKEHPKSQAYLDDAAQMGQPKARRIHSGSITVATLLDRHLAAKAARAPKTVEADRYHAGIARGQFGDRLVSTLDTTEIEIWSARTGVAASSRKKQVEILRAAIRRGIRDRLVEENPADGIVVPLGHKEKPHWSLAELLAVIEATSPGLERALISVLALMGARLGEARALTIRDFQLSATGDAGTLAIVNSGSGSDQTKTRASRRILPVPPIVLPEIIDLAAGRPRSDWLFNSPRKAGEPLGETYANGVITRAVGKANRGRSEMIQRLNVHGLRHKFAAVTLSELGGDLLSVSRALGHAKPSITLNEYGHLAPTGIGPLMADLSALATERRAALERGPVS